MIFAASSTTRLHISSLERSAGRIEIMGLFTIVSSDIIAFLTDCNFDSDLAIRTICDAPT
jgi:hypothetical protein